MCKCNDLPLFPFACFFSQMRQKKGAANPHDSTVVKITSRTRNVPFLIRIKPPFLGSNNRPWRVRRAILHPSEFLPGAQGLQNKRNNMQALNAYYSLAQQHNGKKQQQSLPIRKATMTFLFPYQTEAKPASLNVFSVLPLSFTKNESISSHFPISFCFSMKPNICHSIPFAAH